MDTATEVNAGQERPSPGNSPFARVEVLDVWIEEDTERVAYTVDDEVAHEGRQDDYPAPTSIGRHRRIMDLHKNRKC